jgi:hypothetical protein
LIKPLGGIPTTELLAVWTRDSVQIEASQIIKTGQITQSRFAYIKIRIIHKTLNFILIHTPDEM